MKNKKIVKFILFCSITILYILFGFRPLSTSLQLTPVWTTDIENTTEQNTKSENVLPFKLGQNVGYFSHDGKIVTLKNFEYKATISPKYFTSYSQNSTKLDIYDRKGKIIANISAGGYPYIIDETIFILLPGGAGFEVKDFSNTTICRYQHTSPITSFNSNKHLTAVGFADGTICLFNNKFELLNKTIPGGSNLPVILGSNISSKGNYIACVSGHDKQRFVLYKKKENHTQIIHHKYIDNSLFRQTFVYFTEDESKVFYNDSTGIGILDCEKFDYKHINIPGKVLNIQESTVGNTIFVLSKERTNNRNLYTVTILESKIHKTGSFSFEADSAFILTDKNTLFIGKDNKISKILVSKE